MWPTGHHLRPISFKPKPSLKVLPTPWDFRHRVCLTHQRQDWEPGLPRLGQQVSTGHPQGHSSRHLARKEFSGLESLGKHELDAEQFAFLQDFSGPLTCS